MKAHMQKRLEKRDEGLRKPFLVAITLLLFVSVSLIFTFHRLGQKPATKDEVSNTNVVKVIDHNTDQSKWVAVSIRPQFSTEPRPVDTEPK